jgi:hypothetical protein
METTKPAGGEWFVSDSNAKVAPRTHEIPVKTDANGVVLQTASYKLSADIPTPMPENHARFFLRDKAFMVFAPGGEFIPPIVVKDGGLGSFELGEDEVLAEYSELSKQALYKRCKIIPGSDDIKEKTPIDDMIAFLKSKRKAQVGRGRGSEGVVGAMNAAELDAILV